MKQLLLLLSLFFLTSSVEVQTAAELIGKWKLVR